MQRDRAILHRDLTIQDLRDQILKFEEMMDSHKSKPGISSEEWQKQQVLLRESNLLNESLARRLLDISN